MKNKNLIYGAIALIAVIGMLVFFGDRPTTPNEQSTNVNVPQDVPDDAILISMRTLKNRWTWEPKVLELNVGDRVIITATNEDLYDHGLTISAFNIFEVLQAKSETTIDFVVDADGEFDFYCSIPCGAGHQRMTGKVIVSPAVNVGEDQSIDVLGETAPENEAE